MKKIFLAFCLLGMTVLLLASRINYKGTITGRVVPVGAARYAIAIGESDSIKVNVISGAFSISATPGTYKLSIQADSPYKGVVIDDVQVTEGAVKDLGEIQLKQ